jgi:hypothetical protein
MAMSRTSMLHQGVPSPYGKIQATFAISNHTLELRERTDNLNNYDE